MGPAVAGGTRSMSKARPVYPGDVVFSTRRVHRRQLLLKPDARLNQAIEYIVAVLAARYGILLHALCVMGNHTHDVATDPLGRIVDFQRDCHALIARVVNAMYGDVESLWSRKPTCRESCLEPDDVLDKVAYTMANPVAAGLVAHGKNWPGVRRAWPMKPRTVRRPPGFFRDEAEGGRWPVEATLEFHRPPGYEDLSDAELTELVNGLVEGREEKARTAVRAEGKTFVGRAQVLRHSRYAYPRKSERNSGIRPTVASRCRWRRMERLRRDREWRERYDDATRRVCAGERNVQFPYGTYKLRVYYGFATEPAPDSTFGFPFSTCSRAPASGGPLHDSG